MKDHALALAARGLPVFPTNRKVPRTPRGFYDATTDPARIRELWTRWPKADIAIRTGGGLSVLDVDGDPGRESLEQLEEEHGTIRTLTARTGGGGLHFYFAGDLPCRTGFMRGLDVKGAGGYVVAPPSLHASGRRYEWIPDQPDRPQPVYPWLRQLLVDPPRPIRAPSPTTPPPGERSSRYVQAAIEAECVAVSEAPEGERNHTLNAAAFALARFVAAGEADAGAIREALTIAAHFAGLPDFEIRRTIASAFRARKAA